MRILVFFFAVCFALLVNASEKKLIFEPNSLTIEKNKTNNVKVSLVSDNNQSVCLNFTYGDENEEFSSTDIIKVLEPILIGPLRNQSSNVEIHALKVGHLVIGARSNEVDIPFSDIFRIDVIHSSFLNILIQIVGWVYFVAWSISFYPQVFLNYRLKDVSGLSLDYIALNFLGHSCYSVFNVSFYWISRVQSEYFSKHPRGVNPVLLNDVFFSLHAVTITALTGIQCLFYKKAGHKMSVLASSLFGIMISVLVVGGIINSLSVITVLDYIYIFSYIKLAITIMKYIPQAYINYKRKSTVGWSIVNVLLDFTGGSLSLLQMFLLAFNYNDWTSIFGSPTKLGLGLLSIFFDFIFIFQHYVLYRHSDNEYTPIS
ncbi:cystinosin-like isoform X1 [Brachionus plicatilis]|uniref:Cystinosin-like isoform X1 n=1 Tax=Brachionus plicatilis TaxID=10195 RepID=A0A3M7R205_BRAPC|nr:cystinosin-like isoform X1 [Brachionus plicatilis]